MVHLGLSKRKHLPALFAKDNPYAFKLWEYSLAKEVEKSGLLLDGLGICLLTQDQSPYDPPYSLEGKTVLDIGASNGECAWWYMKKFGASHVISIECDPEQIYYLKRNQEYLNKNFGKVDVIAEPFNIKHLTSNKFDFIKCDCEGYEMILIDYMNQGNKLPPTVVEAHTDWIRDRFLEKGFTVKKRFFDNMAQVSLNVMINW